MVKISVVIPAHNEEDYLLKCIQSVKTAAKEFSGDVEIVVCVNRCTDATEQIAREQGAIVVEEIEANVASVRNAGMAAASGDVIVTLDADSTISSYFLCAVESKMKDSKYAGGCALLIVDEFNLASILLGVVLVFPALMLMRFSAGTFWISRKTYSDVGGFDESYLTGEDFEYWRRLRRYARSNKLKFGMLIKSYVLTSGRKMDEFGPWFMLTHPHWFYYAIKGDNQEFADRYLYKTSRTKGKNSKSEK